MHEGHRRRMLEKLSNGDNLYDHEILEAILYFVCPRVNTNPVAHNLLERFCSLSGVINADKRELLMVEGVGESTANYLIALGCMFKRVSQVEGLALLKTAGDCKKFVSMRFFGKTEEYLELYFTEKSGRVTRIYNRTSFDRNKVVTDAGDVIEAIALAKPYGIIAAHNHLNGTASPSENDVMFTKQLQLICNMNNVVLFDHYIYAGENNIFSFKDDGELGEYSRKYSLDGAKQWLRN